MAIRRIAPQGSKGAHMCLGEGCKGRLLYSKKQKAAKCQKCGMVHIIFFTDMGNVILTDKSKRHLFRKYALRKKK